jgi:hypothetical protein
MRDRDDPGPLGMPKVMVAPGDPDKPPACLFQKPDDRPAVHRTRRTTSAP